MEVANKTVSSFLKQSVELSSSLIFFKILLRIKGFPRNIIIKRKSGKLNAVDKSLQKRKERRMRKERKEKRGESKEKN